MPVSIEKQRRLQEIQTDMAFVEKHLKTIYEAETRAPKCCGESKMRKVALLMLSEAVGKSRSRLPSYMNEQEREDF